MFMKRTKLFLLLIAMLFAITLTACGGGGDGGGGGGSDTPSSNLTTPTNLTATAISSSSIRLNWTNSASNATGFKIERSTSSTVNFAQLPPITNASTTSYTDTGLNPSTIYYYRIRAYNSNGDSGYSNTANATTDAPPVALPAPSLSGPATSSGTFTLTWTFNWSGGLVSTQDGYELEESTTNEISGFHTIFNTINQNDHVSPRSYSLTRGTGTYHFRARASKVGTFSPWSNVVTVSVSAGRTLRIINDLDDRTFGTNVWGKLNTIIRVRIGTSDTAVQTNTGLERLWPIDSASGNSDAYLYEIRPALNATTQYWDFNVSAFSSVGYWVYVQTGWWDYYAVDDTWQKHMSVVVGCLGQDTYKWSTSQISNHTSGTRILRASQILPMGSWYGSSFCP